EDAGHLDSAVRRGETRFHQLADNIPEGFIYQVVQDPQRGVRFSYVSRGIEALLGLAPAEVVADAGRLYGPIHEEDLPRLRAGEEEALHALKPFNCRFRSRSRKGELRWLHCRSAPRPLPGAGTVWDGVAIDVTERVVVENALRQSEERYRDLFENANDVIYTL